MSLQENFASTADQIEKQIASVFASLSESAKGKPGERLVAVSKDVSLSAVKQWREFNENAIEILEQLANLIKDNTEKLISQGGETINKAADVGKAVSGAAADAAEEIADEIREESAEVVKAAKKAASGTRKTAKKAAGKTAAKAKAQAKNVGAMTKSLASMTKAELLDYAKANKVAANSSMTKAEIKKAIEG